MITIKKGNFLNAEEKVIGHVVNCTGTVEPHTEAVFKKYSDAGNDYRQLISGADGYPLFGTTTFTDQQKDGHIIANIYGQTFPEGTDYSSDEMFLYGALEELANTAKANNWSVALPYYVCFNSESKLVLEELMDGVDCALYKL